MYRFALRPLWIVSHVFVAFLVVLCVNLGFWQLRRHDERAERNAQVIARSEAPVVDVQTLVAEFNDVEYSRYRPASVEGEYLRDADLLIDNRSNDGLPGAWVVTPLRTDDGRIVAVSRGFLRFDDGELVPPSTPTGTVAITGTALPWTDGCGVRTGDDGTPIGASCMDREAVATLAGEPVEPLAVQLQSSTAGDEGLVPVPLPELDSGPHRSYAVQWFIFGTIGLIGYPLVLRKVARDRAVPDATEGPEAPEPVGVS